MYDEDMLAAEKNGEYLRKPGERSGERTGEEPENPEATAWEMAMKGETGGPVPAFAGEDWHNPSASAKGEALDDLATADPEAELDAELAKTDELSSANQLTSFGLDTATRYFGARRVIDAVLEIDETGQNADNPLGDIYRHLAPDKQTRAFLYNEIRKERVQNNQYNTDSAVADDEDPRLGFTASGDFYDKTRREPGKEQASVDAIRAFRRLVEMLETSERFADVRERAAEQGKDIIDYLISDKENPTLTDFFNRVGDEMSEEDVEEVVAELEEQVNPELESQREPEAEPAEVPLDNNGEEGMAA